MRIFGRLASDLYHAIDEGFPELTAKMKRLKSMHCSYSE